MKVAIKGRGREGREGGGGVLRGMGRPEEPADPALVVERSELVEALRKLPPKQSAAIVLRPYHGYSNREIGIALDVPERTVASRLAAARARLQQLLQGTPIASRKNG